MLHFVTMVRGDALQPADRDGFAIDACAPAGRLARAITRPSENSGEHIRRAVQQVRFREPAVRDEPDVLGNVGMCRARPLTVDYAMVVGGISNIGRTHATLGVWLNSGLLSG